MSLLLDLTDCCPDHANHALEYLCKAQGEEPSDIWAPHPNPLVRRIVELFTARGLKRSEGLTKELAAWLAGDRHKPASETIPRPDGAMLRWTGEELALVRTYLQALRPDEFTLDDWSLVVDYLVQRYLPTSDLRSEADWLASRSALMGRIQAALGEVTLDQADTLLTRLPSIERAPEMGLTREMRAVLDFGRAHCCERVVNLADQTRHRLKDIVIDHQEALYLGDKAGVAESVQTKLFDAEGVLNRDWRRIAVTEATENVNSGFIASLQPGTKVKRIEMYGGACDFCRSINGMVLTVVDPKAADKDWDEAVWVGKTNEGRSASPKKRTPAGLVDRTPEELWRVPAGAVHPHCRGQWARASSASADPTFEAWLEAQRKKAAA